MMREGENRPMQNIWWTDFTIHFLLLQVEANIGTYKEKDQVEGLGLGLGLGLETNMKKLTKQFTRRKCIKQKN